MAESTEQHVGEIATRN